MSYKKFSSAQDTSSDNKSEDKSKDAPAADQPNKESDKAPAEVMPEPKS